MSTPQIKAQLIKLAMRSASAAKISPRAQALLAHLVAESWPADGAWITTRTNPQLVAALSCSEDSVRRAIRELERAELVRRRTGRGHLRSRFVVTLAEVTEHAPEVAPVRPPTPQPCNLGGGTRATSKVAPMRPPLKTSRNQSEASPTRDRGGRNSTPPAPAVTPVTTQPDGGDGAAIAPDQERIPMTQPPEILARIISTRPAWLSDEKPWIDQLTALELSQRPGITIEIVQWAIAETRSRRKSLQNPAGYCISRIRQPGAGDLVRAEIRRKRLASENQRAIDDKLHQRQQGAEYIEQMSPQERQEIREMFEARRTKREIADASTTTA